MPRASQSLHLEVRPLWPYKTYRSMGINKPGKSKPFIRKEIMSAFELISWPHAWLIWAPMLIMLALGYFNGK
jgi:hypothetical protein